MKQMTLFEVMNDTKNEKNNSDPEPIGEANSEKLTPCCICGVLPEIRGGRPGYKLARCPRCRFECGTLYNIADHWNGLQKYRMKEWSK